MTDKKEIRSASDKREETRVLSLIQAASAAAEYARRIPEIRRKIFDLLLAEGFTEAEARMSSKSIQL